MGIILIVVSVIMISGVSYAADTGISGISAGNVNATSGVANISYTLNSVSHGHVTADILDSAGVMVRTVDGGYQDSGSNRIAWDGKDSAGKAVPAGNYTVKLTVNAFDPSSYTFAMQFGGMGNASGQLMYPRGIKIDKSGNVYVTDPGNERVQVFYPNGTVLSSDFNTGSMFTQFFWPNDVALAPDGDIYVCQISGTANVKKFDSGRNYLSDVGASGAKSGQYLTPYAIDTDPDGNLYVLDNSFGQAGVLKYDASGNFLVKWGTYGVNDGQFAAPDGIAVGSSGRVYVSDTLNNRVQVFDLNGKLLNSFGSYGSGDGQFIKPKGIAVSAGGNVFVADSDNNRVQVFSRDGTFITKFGSSGAGQLISVEGVAADQDGNVYVTDYSNGTVLKFSPAAIHVNGTGSIIVDVTPPVTEITLSGSHDANGTYAVGTTVALKAADNDSGVSSIDYSLDSVNWTVYSAPFTLDNAGSITVYYRSADKAGNQETAKSKTVDVSTQITATSVPTTAPVTATPGSGSPYGALVAFTALGVGAMLLAHKKK